MMLATRSLLLASLFATLAGAVDLTARLAPVWPCGCAYYRVEVFKTAGKEMTDVSWAHLHEGEVDALTVDLQVRLRVTQTIVDLPAGAAGWQARYTVRGTPVSDWLNYPASFTLALSDSDLAGHLNGIHDVSVEVRATNTTTPTGQDGASSLDYHPAPMFLHAHWTGRGTATTVPVLAEVLQSTEFGSTVKYISVTDRNLSTNFNVAPDVTGLAGAGWTTFPAYDADLYQEHMQPHTDQFGAAQMWWEEPAGTIDAGLKFVRGFPPKSGEAFPFLYYGGNIAFSAFGDNGHRNFPVKDGPRGIGWTNGYIQGVVDSHGNLFFVNTSGQLRVMFPNGELKTIMGWRVKADEDPVWWLKPLDSIRTNMELIGTWTNGQDAGDPGFHQPMDVQLDPLNENIAYIAGGYDQVIWKVTFDRSSWVGTAEVFAGSTSRTSGYTDATGTAARFWFPISLTPFEAGCDCMYVADFDNDAIRKVTRSGVVTTAYGHTGVSEAIQAIDSSKVEAGSVANPGTRLVAITPSFTRANIQFTVNSTEAGMGVRPDIFMPMTVRFDSSNNLIVWERGLNSIRKIMPSTHVTTEITHINDGGCCSGGLRGWAWIDVDRFGATAPVNTTYLVFATSYDIPNGETNDHFNEEAWAILPDGTEKYIVGPDALNTPAGIGPVAFTDFPHYPWLVAVDPRGALYFAGIGEHGITRLRQRKSTDPTFNPLAAFTTGIGTYGDVFLDAPRMWERGSADLETMYTCVPTAESTPGAPGQHKFGLFGENLIGMPTAWSLSGSETDADLISRFEIPASIQANANCLSSLLYWLRFSKGTALEASLLKRRIRRVGAPN